MYVRLEQEWTDGEGTTHAAGSMVEVDATTLAELEQSGIVADPSGGQWAGSTGGEADPQGGHWPGPTGGEASPQGGHWPGPTGGSGG